ncbi:hypothetical protein GLYMA_17G138900v4 [Glycine max]|uniref:Uncharacterized protein n=1 Tax=Glycine max TaxID=3847 RepID=K7MLJ6_SOYBN|nr:hypothetical protein GYH30_047226 [Glycine max]KRH04087.1 hypothetical protein GLYMA_17G138900v4 [Glycine max]
MGGMRHHQVDTFLYGNPIFFLLPPLLTTIELERLPLLRLNECLCPKILMYGKNVFLGQMIVTRNNHIKLMTLYDPFGVSSLCLPTPSISNKTITLTTVDFHDQK